MISNLSRLIPSMIDSPTLEDQIVIALRRITRAIDLRSRVLLQFHGLTAPQLAVLRAIGQQKIGELNPEETGTVTPGEIARAVHLGQPTVTGILDRLAQRKLIERRRGDRDKRSQSITLSPAGQKVLKEAPSPLQETFRQELSQLREWERTQILATLQRIADMMQSQTGVAEALITRPCLGEEPAISVEADVSLSADPSWMEVPQALH
jgi:DNA-binding MarR family transcriptional regulator